MLKNKVVRNLLSALAAFSLVLILSGCGDHSADQEQASVGEDAVVADISFPEQTDSSISFLPEYTTVLDDIQALLHGMSKVEKVFWRINGALVKEADGLVLSRRHFSRGDVVEVLVVADGMKTAASTSVYNSPPEVTAVPVRNPRIYRGIDIEAKPQAHDADGDTIEFHYTWSLNGETLPWVTGSTLEGDQFRKGDMVKLDVVPFDGEDEGQSFDCSEFEILNAPPIFISQPPESFRTTEYSYQAIAEDPDEEEVVYDLTKGPAGMTINPASGLIRWPVPGNLDGEFEVRIEARDPEGLAAHQEYLLRLKKGE